MYIKQSISELSDQTFFHQVFRNPIHMCKKDEIVSKILYFNTLILISTRVSQPVMYII